MSISSRFSVGIHLLTLIKTNKDGLSSSGYLAESVTIEDIVNEVSEEARP